MIFFVSLMPSEKKAVTIRNVSRQSMYLFVSSSSDYLLHGSLFVYNFSDSLPLNMGHLTNLRVTNVISNFDIWFLMTRVLWSHIISNFSPPNTWLLQSIDCPQQTRLWAAGQKIRSDFVRFQNPAALSVHYQRQKTKCSLYYYACLVHFQSKYGSRIIRITTVFL